MSTPEKKYSVTQEQIDVAMRAVSGSTARPEKVKDAKASPVKSGHVWTIKSQGAELVGLHIRTNQTFVVQMTKKMETGFKGVLKAGYEQPEKLEVELASLVHRMGRGVQYAVTLSGKHAPFLMTKAPDLGRTVLMKTLKVQMKALIGEEVDDLEYLKLPLKKAPGESGDDYIATLVTPAIFARTIELLKKVKLRLFAWDCDMLCYARAASFLWQENGIEGATRFVVVMGWNRCRLLIMGADGRFVAPVLPMGVVSFLEHLSTTLGEPNINASWLDSKKLILQAQDTADVRNKKMLANQAIFTLFVPFAQQVKMYLYKSCNDFNIELPSHFSVVGPGSHLFRVSDSLEQDLGMKALKFSNGLEPEMAAALGAALWDRHESHLNVLPATGGEMVERVKDFFLNVKEKVAKYIPKRSEASPSGKLSFLRVNMGRIIGAGAATLVLLLAYPIWQHARAGKALASAKREIDALGPKKEVLIKYTEKQTVFDKKRALKKTLENHRSHMTTLMKEVLFNLPSTVRLNSILAREKTVTLKGVAKTQADLEGLLELYSRLEYVKSPEPLSIRRTDQQVSFEIQMQIKH